MMDKENAKENSSFIELQIKNFIERIRPEESVRPLLDIGYSFKNNTLVIFEIRPHVVNPGIYCSYAAAKARFIKSIGKWRLYWLRANGKWEHFKPYADSSSIREVLKNIEEDKYGAFFG